MEKGEIILYQPDNSVELEVRIEAETVWLTQAQMALLFETTRNNVTLHIGNIFKEGELDENSVCKESLLTASDGKSYRTKISSIEIETRRGIHDRFLIIDDTVYHVGASLKDLGKKLFAFSKLGIPKDKLV